MRKVFLVGLFLCYHFMLSAQLSYGTTGLLHTPSAEMQKDKTVMLGGNFLNQEITPPKWTYHTYNYFLNVTIFSFLEMAYTCTLFKAESLPSLDESKFPGFRNQDRYFSARLRVLKEGQFWKYMPAVVLGTSDPYTGSGGGKVSNESGNGYFCRFYLAASKHFQIGNEDIGLHLSYLYNRRTDYKLNGLAGGITYSPSQLPDLKIIAEYDSKDVAFGATYLLFNHLHMLVEMQKMKYFTGGLTFIMHLK